MSSMKVNLLTREIEIKGPESFIESNFDKVQDLLIKSFGVKRMAAKMAKADQETISTVKRNESEVNAEIAGQERSKISQLSTAPKPSIQAISQKFKDTRQPLRKYIRKVGVPGHERTVVEVVEEKPKELTLASLKEKFGLTETKMNGIFRDAEKFDKSSKPPHGSYGSSHE